METAASGERMQALADALLSAEREGGRPVVETVAIRFPKAVWVRVRRRALDRGETGLSWLSRCAEVCLGVAETGVSRGGVSVAAAESAGRGAEDLALKEMEALPLRIAEDPARSSVAVPGIRMPTGDGRLRLESSRCPTCGCLPSCHRQGAKQNRCEAHPTCVWVAIPPEDRS